MSIPWKWIWTFIAVTNATVLLINIGTMWSITAMIDVAQVQKEAGYAYRISLKEVEGRILETQFSTWNRRTRQQVAFFENGKEVGLHAAALSQIREVGRGASLQWGPTFFFSTSDNSDPTLNGRAYAISFPLVVKGWIVGVLVALTLFLAVLWGWSLKSQGWLRVWQSARTAIAWMQTSRAASRLANTVTVCGVAMAGFIVYRILLDATESVPTLSPDSFSYLDWRQSRTPGYPLFLQTIFTFTDDARWIVPIQVALLLIASTVLGWALGRLFHSRLTGIAVTLSLFTATPILMTSWLVQTEALYAAGMCFHLAAVATFLRTESRTAAWIVGCMVGAMIAVRPSGYALVACLPLLLLFKQCNWRSRLGFLTGGLALALALIVAVQYAKHGLLSTQSFGGFSLAGHVAPLITEDLVTPEHEVAARVARRLAPLVHDIPDPFASPAAHTHAYLEHVNPMMYENIMPEILAVMREREPSLPDPIQWRRADAVAMSLALSAVMSQPSWYLMHSLANCWDMWGKLETDIGGLEHYFFEYRHITEALIRSQPGGVRHFETDWYVTDILRERYHPVDAPPIQSLDQIWAALPYWRPLTVRLIFVSSLLATLGLFWAGGLPASCQFVVYCGIALQACIGFLGFVVPGTYRFVIPLLPIIIVIVVGGSTMLMRWGWETFSPRTFASWTHIAVEHVDEAKERVGERG